MIDGEDINGIRVFLGREDVYTVRHKGSVEVDKRQLLGFTRLKLLRKKPNNGDDFGLLRRDRLYSDCLDQYTSKDRPRWPCLWILSIIITSDRVEEEQLTLETNASGALHPALKH